MIGPSKVFKFGVLYIDEVRRLIDEKRIDAPEAAALLVQADSLYELAGEIAQQQHNTNRILTTLSNLGDYRRIESMLARGINPIAVRGIRARRYGEYRRLRCAAQAEFLADSVNMCHEYARAREWPMYWREGKRQIVARYLFADLWWAGVRFRLGFRAEMAPSIRKLMLAAEGLPHRGDCAA